MRRVMSVLGAAAVLCVGCGSPEQRPPLPQVLTDELAPIVVGILETDRAAAQALTGSDHDRDAAARALGARYAR